MRKFGPKPTKTFSGVLSEKINYLKKSYIKLSTFKKVVVWIIGILIISIMIVIWIIPSMLISQLKSLR